MFHLCDKMISLLFVSSVVLSDLVFLCSSSKKYIHVTLSVMFLSCFDG